ncbi:hypothetical protein [Morganella morganii]|uniref:hypothetical protein n=1 Tax=Morganella morganii TaxID=582 RepID=UPI0011E60414|nr:hypothetical protein [Morganella morganii]
MAKAAEIAKTDKKWWTHFEEEFLEDGWIPMLDGSFNMNSEYRLKPHTIDINGHQVPEPVREPPEYGTWFCVPSTDCVEMVAKIKWTGDECCEHYLRSGIVHTNSAAAICHTVALLSFTQK